MNKIKAITPGKKYINQMFIMGSVFLAIGLVAFAIMGVWIGLGPAIVILIVAAMQQNKEIIKMYDENIELKLAPLASTRYIKYSEIISIDNNKQKVIVRYKQGSDSKKIAISKQLIDENELGNFIELLESKKS